MTPKILVACKNLGVPQNKVSMIHAALRNGKVKNNPKVSLEDIQSHGCYSLPPDNPREALRNIILGWKGERSRRQTRLPSIFDQGPRHAAGGKP